MKGNGKEGKLHPTTLLAEEMLSKALKEVFGDSITYSHKELEYGPLRNIGTFERNEVSSHELRMVRIPNRKKFGIYIYFEGLVQLSEGHDLQPKVFEGKFRFYRMEGKWHVHFIQVDREGVRYRYDAVWPGGILALRPERDPTAPRPVPSGPF